MLEQVELQRYEMKGLLGIGADYEVRAATDRETGQSVVLKRPLPESLRHRQHDGIEARTERMVQAHAAVGTHLPNVARLLGYTARANHDASYGENLGQTYHVLVAERAVGIPLMGDMKARFTGVPIGVGQNLFALFPLLPPPRSLHTQLLDIEEAFFRAGYILLDLRPHNVFYQPATGGITVIDCGALTEIGAPPGRRGMRPPDIHDFYLEMLKFYTTAQLPPRQAQGYRDPYGVRPVVNFERELDQMAQQFRNVPEPTVQVAARTMIDQVKRRAYTSFADFRHDLTDYLTAVQAMHQTLAQQAETQQAWHEALAWLGEEYWQRYLFDAPTELAGLRMATSC